MREFLTHERLRGLFRNNFELSNFAIRLGRYFIKSGHEVSLDELLDQVRRNPSSSYLEDLQKAEEAEDQEQSE